MPGLAGAGDPEDGFGAGGVFDDVFGVDLARGGAFSDADEFDGAAEGGGGGGQEFQGGVAAVVWGGDDLVAAGLQGPLVAGADFDGGDAGVAGVVGGLDLQFVVLAGGERAGLFQQGALAALKVYSSPLLEALLLVSQVVGMARVAPGRCRPWLKSTRRQRKAMGRV